MALLEKSSVVTIVFFAFLAHTKPWNGAVSVEFREYCDHVFIIYIYMMNDEKDFSVHRISSLSITICRLDKLLLSNITYISSTFIWPILSWQIIKYSHIIRPFPFYSRYQCNKVICIRHINNIGYVWILFKLKHFFQLWILRILTFWSSINDA